MYLEEVKATAAYDLSPHRHAFINPYNGCSMGCPFCFWLSQEGWEGRIQIRTDIAKRLEEALKTWPREEFIYLGSVCDPFNELEKTYRLSKQCLELIRQYEIPLVITTSAATPVVLEYAELLKSMKQRVVIVVELARIPLIEAMGRGEDHVGIVHANLLRRAGLEVWATLAPVLPGITDMEAVLERLDERIPVYIDRLGCKGESVQAQKMMAWLQQDYPALQASYREMIDRQDWTYFDEVLKFYNQNKRIKTFPFEL